MSILPSAHLGHDGPSVPAMGLGLMGLSAFYNAASDPSDEARFAVLDAAYAAGQLLWDSADVYGDNEDLIGRWFKKTGKRSDIILMTKFGCSNQNGVSKIDSTPEHAKKACEQSLKRLGSDYIDVYFCQRPDGKTPIEKTVKAMIQLKECVDPLSSPSSKRKMMSPREGKIRHLGMSQCSADTLRRAHAVHPIAAVQIEYSPFFLESESNGLFDTAMELGIAFIAYGPLGRGFGTNAFSSPSSIPAGDIRLTHPRFMAQNWDTNMELVQGLEQHANRKGCTLPQLILAWELAQPGHVIPIPGATTVDELSEDLKAFSVTIDDAESVEIRKMIEAKPQVGGIYPHAESKALFADTPPMTTAQKLEDAEDLYLTIT